MVKGYSGDSYHQLPHVPRFLPFGQPPFRTTSLRPVRFSRSRTKPSDPSGLPVERCLRSRASSISATPSARSSRQSHA